MSDEQEYNGHLLVRLFDLMDKRSFDTFAEIYEAIRDAHQCVCDGDWCELSFKVGHYHDLVRDRKKTQFTVIDGGDA